MKKAHIKSIIHDILNLNDWRHPLANSCFVIGHKKIRVDLLRGEVLGSGKDSIWKFYHEKIDWFKRRVKDLNGNLKDFTKAKIYVDDDIERIEIVYKNEIFERKVNWSGSFEDIEKIKEFNKKLKKLKPEDGVLKRG